jgi:hypothetical protein
MTETNKKTENMDVGKTEDANLKPAAEQSAKPQNDFFTAGHGVPTGESIPLTPEEKKARKRRNFALAFGIVAFLFLVYAISMLRMAESVR